MGVSDGDCDIHSPTFLSLIRVFLSRRKEGDEVNGSELRLDEKRKLDLFRIFTETLEHSSMSWMVFTVLYVIEFF